MSILAAVIIAFGVLVMKFLLTPPHDYLASQLPNHALKAVDDQIITLFFHGKENFPDLRPLP